MDTGVAKALVDLREAGFVTVAVRTHAGEFIDAVNTGATIMAGVDGTFIYINITHCTGVTRRAGTLIAIDLVNTCPIVTWVALAVINVDLTVDSSGALGAAADVCILSVLAGASIPAWLA